MDAERRLPWWAIIAIPVGTMALFLLAAIWFFGKIFARFGL